MKSRKINYASAGLCFAAGCIWLAIPGPSKYIATILFFIAALANLFAAQNLKK
ncbi:MAG: hypothetical protein U0451_01900 [Candidatus Saccharimonadales bacterium]